MWKKAIFVVFIALIFCFVYRSLYDTLDDSMGKLHKNYPSARIIRDEYGVPYVFGDKDNDTAFALAYAHAEDDFAMIQKVLLAGRGHLARVVGKHAGPSDYLVGLVRIKKYLDDRYHSDLSEDTHALLQGYSNGLNYYAWKHPNEVLSTGGMWSLITQWICRTFYNSSECPSRSLFPVYGQDVVGGFLHKMPLFYNLDKTLQELLERPKEKRGVTAHSKHTLSKKKSEKKQYDVEDIGGSNEKGEGYDLHGSNVFAVSPLKMMDNSTVLVINSHQPWSGPVAWYEAHIRSKSGWRVSGSLFPGSPIPMIGYNDNLGWGHTVNRPDVVDVYKLVTDPEDPDLYLMDGEWYRLEVTSHHITSRLFGIFMWTVTRDVKWSTKHNAPVIQTPSGSYAIKMAGHGDIRAVEQWYKMGKATTFDQWMKAMKMQAVPMLNTGYADHNGTIYMVYNALIPQRSKKSKVDWSIDIPGSLSSLVWDSYVPFHRLPQVLNPPTGFVQNCNSAPFNTTYGEKHNPSLDDVDKSWGIETLITNRASRLLSLLSQGTNFSLQDVLSIKYDMEYTKESQMASFVSRAIHVYDQQIAGRGKDKLLRAAVALLRNWDMKVNPENRAAALPVVSFTPFMKLSIWRRPEVMLNRDEELLLAVSDTSRLLYKRYGRIDPLWSEVNTLKRGSVILGLGGGPDVLHAVVGSIQKNGKLVGHTGDCSIHIVQWDTFGSIKVAKAIHQYGSNTAHSTSPHYADQSLLFVKRKMRDVFMNDSDVQRAAEKSYYVTNFP